MTQQTTAKKSVKVEKSWLIQYFEFVCHFYRTIYSRKVIFPRHNNTSTSLSRSNQFHLSLCLISSSSNLNFQTPRIPWRGYATVAIQRSDYGSTIRATISRCNEAISRHTFPCVRRSLPVYRLPVPEILTWYFNSPRSVLVGHNAPRNAV